MHEGEQEIFHDMNTLKEFMSTKQPDREHLKQNQGLKTGMCVLERLQKESKGGHNNGNTE